MLSLGSNISATQVVEAKYSASFDGGGDFIELGESDDIISTSQGSVTLMCWVKPQEEAGNQYIFTNKRDSGSSNFSLRIDATSGVRFNALIYTGSSLASALTSTTTVTAGTWYHVAITAKANEQKIYINGQAEHTVTLGFGMAPSTDGCTIASFGSGNEYEGLISELAIFNAYLSGEAVLAAYNSGFDLKTNVGDYINSSNITHYYKMGNGSFDDKAKGIVHDQDNPGFGGELITNGDFSTSGTPTTTSYSLGWILGGSSDGGVAITNGQLVLTGTGSFADARAWAANPAQVGAETLILTAGCVYELTYTIDSNSGTNLQYYNGGGYDDFPSDKETAGTHTIFFTATGTNQFFIIKQGTNGGVTKFSNVSLKKLNGNPGVTSGGVTFSSDTP